MYRPTPTFSAAIAIITMLVAMAAWFMWAISQAQAETTTVRAISAAEHGRCAAMPRGSQLMEMERKECFNELYKTPFRVDTDGSRVRQNNRNDNPQ